MTNILHGIMVRTIDVRRYFNAVVLLHSIGTSDLIFTLERTHNARAVQVYVYIMRMINQFDISCTLTNYGRCIQNNIILLYTAATAEGHNY